MPDTKKTGWERFVVHLLSRIDYVAPVNKNRPQREGTMWADGWRKASKDNQHFGRFCLVTRLRKQMKALKFNPDNQKACLLKAEEWILAKLRSFAPVVHNNYHRLLTINQYPSMNHTKYGKPYTSSNFALFLTFTMFDFHNTPHVDHDVNEWTLVGWIPIFHPENSDNPQILADKGFNMIGGQFSFRDFQPSSDAVKKQPVAASAGQPSPSIEQHPEPSNQATRLSPDLPGAVTHTIADYLNFIGCDATEVVELSVTLKNNGFKSDKRFGSSNLENKGLLDLGVALGVVLGLRDNVMNFNKHLNGI
ncbi:hypothetical protein PCANC_15467 [Puccinia coronata f. sp. avenae]|uniref:Tet-like 2OG-Fe(II) oxygenase domain-containing protein n=1 Tax=Puccinia coronata f. sp. avenae TaxID=200324 RepID=A0A2N5VFB1_9BASI|nr:hypothetical protein PCANC_15467 [Puccinia coronata f. sp. avenae]